MKLFLTTTILIFSQISFANYNWSLVSTDQHFADEPASVQKILNEFPQVLANSEFEAKEIEFVNVTEAVFEFTGETTCSEDDERLTHNSLTYFACPFNKPTECITKFDEILTNSDPCN